MELWKRQESHGALVQESDIQTTQDHQVMISALHLTGQSEERPL